VENRLLTKARSLNRNMQIISEHPINSMEIARVLTEHLDCNVYIVGISGELEGYSFTNPSGCADLDRILGFARSNPSSFNRWLTEMEEPRVNVRIEGGNCIFKVKDVACSCGVTVASIVPVYGGAHRLGTLLLTKSQGLFSEEDIFLAAYSVTVVSNEIIRMDMERREEDARRRSAARIAVSTLSYSEREAIERIMNELDGKQGILVTSHIADRIGITRSVIVSALRKLESARVIASRSLGMKGTFITVHNDYLFEELGINR
jgi:transcriptional pleiotropic repressor